MKRLQLMMKSFHRMKLKKKSHSHCLSLSVFMSIVSFFKLYFYSYSLILLSYLLVNKIYILLLCKQLASQLSTLENSWHLSLLFVLYVKQI